MIVELRWLIFEVKSWRSSGTYGTTSKIKIQQSSLVNDSFQSPYTTPLGLVAREGVYPRVAPLRGSTLGCGTQSRWD